MQPQDRGHGPHPQPHSRSNPVAARWPTQCFAVQALADPGTLPRVLEVFAKRGLVPARVDSGLAEGRDGSLHIDVQLAGAEAEDARLIAQELRRQFCVDTVLVAEKQHP